MQSSFYLRTELSQGEIANLFTYCSAIGVGHKLLNPTFIQEMNNKGLLVYAADVQEEKAAQDMKRIGARGIFTNRPDLLEKE